MSLTLATFASGAVINATTVRTLLGQIETYVNEGTIAADRGSTWCRANHVYRPDFYGDHTTLVSGESYFASRPESDQLRSWWTRYLGDSGGSNAQGYFLIPGLTKTIQIPQTLSTGSHRVRIFASFFAYEFGGVDGNMEESVTGAASFAMLVDGAAQTGQQKPIWKGSSTSANQAYAFYPRKQVSFIRDFDVAAGVHTFGIGVVPANQGTNTKHVVVVQGNLIVRYYCR